jgi:hypothetical protein
MDRFGFGQQFMHQLQSLFQVNASTLQEWYSCRDQEAFSEV